MVFDSTELSKCSLKNVHTRQSNEVKHLSCWYTNATSLNNKYEDLSIEVENKNPDIIMVCETWWTDVSVTNIPGYSLFKKNRNSSKGGGFVYILKKYLNHLKFQKRT